MIFHHAGLPLADRQPDRGAVIITPDVLAARRLGGLVELTGLTSGVEHHASASAAIASGTAGLAILDISPATADAAAQVAQLRQGGVATIVVILPTTAAAVVPDLIAAGVDAVIDSGSSADDLRVVIGAAQAGHCVIARSLTHAWRASEAVATGPSPVLAQLTPRQRQIARALVTGVPAKVIAHNLGLAGGTIKIHASAIYRRLGVRNRTALANLLASAAGR